LSEETLLRSIEAGWARLAAALARRGPAEGAPSAEAAARKGILDALFLRICELLDLPEGADSPLAGPQADVAAEEAAAALSQQDLAGAWAAGVRPFTLLGKVHERLLSCRLHTSKHGKPGVRRSGGLRKARGAFYTPEFVARHIADAALGASARESPAVLDPACGCGAFLVAAVETLRRQGAAPEDLAASLHGMDLDPEAVLAARRSVWLEIVLEPAARGSRLGAEAAREIARRLAENVVAADALADETAGAHAGRFDVVLGNPPYRRELRSKAILDRIAETALGRRWRTARMDLWYYFVFRGLDLLRPGGTLAFIVGSYWAANRGAQRLVGVIRDTCHLEEVLLLDRCRVFPGLAGRHMIFRLFKGGSGPTRIKRPAAPAPADAEPLFGGAAPWECFAKSPDELFRHGRLDLEPVWGPPLDRLDRWPPLGSLGAVRQGIAENPASVTRRANREHGDRWRTGEGVFSLTPEEAAALDLSPHERELLRPYHDLCDLGRYWLADEPSRVLIYSTARTCPDIGRCPAVGRHLERFRPLLDARRETRQGTRPWWQLHWPRDEAVWRSPRKILSVQMGLRPAFAPAVRPIYVPFSVNVFVPDEAIREHVNYLTALLNSRLLWEWFRRNAKQRGAGLEINGHVLARAPIRPIDFSDPADVARHDRIVALVDALLALGRRPPSAPDQADREIDRRVDDLYGLPG
jgi:methylase of polypeptide subunit release factors